MTKFKWLSGARNSLIFGPGASPSRTAVNASPLLASILSNTRPSGRKSGDGLKITSDTSHVQAESSEPIPVHKLYDGSFKAAQLHSDTIKVKSIDTTGKPFTADWDSTSDEWTIYTESYTKPDTYIACKLKSDRHIHTYENALKHFAKYQNIPVQYNGIDMNLKDASLSSALLSKLSPSSYTQRLPLPPTGNPFSTGTPFPTSTFRPEYNAEYIHMLNPLKMGKFAFSYVYSYHKFLVFMARSTFQMLRPLMAFSLFGEIMKGVLAAVSGGVFMFFFSFVLAFEVFYFFLQCYISYTFLVMFFSALF